MNWTQEIIKVSNHPIAMKGHLPVIPWVEIDVPVWDPSAVVPGPTKRLVEVKWAFLGANM